MSKNSEEITKEVKDFLDHFVQNLTKESMNQLNLLKSDISSLKNEEGSWKFPSDGAIEAYTPEVYKLFYDRVCNAASAALVSYLKEMSLISREIEPFSLRENNLDIVKDKIRQPFSVGRFLIRASDTSSSHEFVIINVQSKIYLVQADIYRQLRVDQVGGVCELSDKDLENLFSNDQETFEKLFKLNPKKKANLKIQAFDWYPMSGLNLQKEEGLVELNKQLIADVSCMSENANISTGERIIPKTLSDDESLKVKNSYLEKIGGKERKYHAFKASDTGPNTAQMTQSLKGDLLKNRILAEYADLLNNADNDEKLEKVIDDIQKTPEYEILRKGQGSVTRLFGLKTTSLEVLENMFKERRESLKK